MTHSNDISQWVVNFYDPDYIVRLLAANPIVWHDPDLTCRGGLADQAGMTPTPAVQEFLSFVRHEGRLPTQREYSEWCMGLEAWDGWPEPTLRAAVIAKLERNFYPSMVDTFHAFGLVAKAGWYDQCVMDTVRDVKGKSDITFQSDYVTVHVNLKGPGTVVSKEAERWKAAYRGHGLDVVQIRLPMSRPRDPGNKRWYKLEDFNAIQPSLFAGLV